MCWIHQEKEKNLSILINMYYNEYLFAFFSFPNFFERENESIDVGSHDRINEKPSGGISED